MTGRWSLAALVSTPPPRAAVEVSAAGVTAVALDPGNGRSRVAAWAGERLPAGAVTPALTGANVHDPQALAAAVASALERVGRPRRVALVVPDAAAKVALVRFDKVPGRAGDLEQLVRWQVHKGVPFPIETAQVSWAAGAAGEGGGREYVVTVMARSVVEEYEAACERAGARPGIVDLSTFSLINLVLASRGAGPGGEDPGGDWLVVSVAPDGGSVAIMRGASPVLFRSRAADAGEQLLDVVHQTAMYFEDRLGGRTFEHAFVGGSGPGLGRTAEALAGLLGGRLLREVAVIDPALSVDVDRRGLGDPVALAGAVGVLLRGR